MHFLLDDIVSSYETSVRNIGAILNTTQNILDGFQESFLDRKQEREKISAELREILAKNKSLRWKDFDNMMQAMLLSQDRKEKEVRNLLNCYLNEQGEVVNTLKDTFAGVKDYIAAGETERLKEFERMLRDIFAGQDERKKEVTRKLQEFQREQQEIGKRLEELRTKGKDLRIKDLKTMLKEFNAEHKKRRARRLQRREEVISMLDSFREKRLRKEE